MTGIDGAMEDIDTLMNKLDSDSDHELTSVEMQHIIHDSWWIARRVRRFLVQLHEAITYNDSDA